MRPGLEQIAAELASVLSDLLEEVDPDCEEHPHTVAALQRYRVWAIEAAGQSSLDLPMHPLEACE